MRFAAHCVVSLTAIATAVLAGCGSPTPANPDASQSHMKVLGMLYGMYQSDHGGSPPANKDQFIAFLQETPANWNKIATMPEQLLSSPRNSEPLTILYGKEAIASSGDPWVAYEANPTEGKRLIVNSRGAVKLVDDQEFNQLVQNSN